MRAVPVLSLIYSLSMSELHVIACVFHIIFLHVVILHRVSELQLWYSSVLLNPQVCMVDALPISQLGGADSVSYHWEVGATAWSMQLTM